MALPKWSLIIFKVPVVRTGQVLPMRQSIEVLCRECDTSRDTSKYSPPTFSSKFRCLGDIPWLSQLVAIKTESLLYCQCFKQYSGEQFKPLLSSCQVCLVLLQMNNVCYCLCIWDCKFHHKKFVLMIKKLIIYSWLYLTFIKFALV